LTTVLITIFRFLTLIFAIAIVSTMLAVASDSETQSTTSKNQVVRSSNTLCFSEHNDELFHCPRGHLGSQIVTPEIPQPKPPKNLLSQDLESYSFDQSINLINSIVETKYHSSVPALYLTTLRLRL